MLQPSRFLRAALAFPALALLALAPGCDDGNPTAPGIAPLIGTWNATSALFTNRANPSQSVDVVRQLKAVITLDIRGDGRATLTLIAFGQIQTQSGSARVEGDTLILKADDPTRPEDRFAYQLQGNTLTLQGRSEWDFNQSGVPLPADLRLVLVRT